MSILFGVTLPLKKWTFVAQVGRDMCQKGESRGRTVRTLCAGGGGLRGQYSPSSIAPPLVQKDKINLLYVF